MTMLMLATDIVEAENNDKEQFGYGKFLNCLPDFYDTNPEIFYNNLYEKVYILKELFFLQESKDFYRKIRILYQYLLLL